MAAAQPSRCREAVGWHASHNQENGFTGFVGFVIFMNAFW